MNNVFISESFVAWVFSAVFVGGVLFNHSLRYTPPWLYRDVVVYRRWSDVNLAALFASFGTSAFAAYAYSGSSLAHVSLSTVIVGILTYCAVQTFESDFAFREADRFLLRYAIAAVLLLSFGYYALHENMLMVGAILILVMAGFFIALLPGIGLSDARAFLLMLVSSIAVSGAYGIEAASQGMTMALQLFIVFIILYAVIYMWRRNAWNILKEKISIPAVPLILMPTILTLCFLPVI